MYMNGEYLETLQDLKRCFCIDELVYSYYNGELELFLDKIGAHEKGRAHPENSCQQRTAFDTPVRDLRMQSGGFRREDQE